MFISDFAIKRPIITVTAMVALVVFGVLALLKLKTDEFPDIQAPRRRSEHRVSRRVAGRGRARDRRSRSRSGLGRSAGVDGEQVDVLRRSMGSRSSSLFFDFEKRSSRRRRTCATRSRRSARICRTEMKEPILTRLRPDRGAGVPLALSSTTTPPAELTRLADPGITRELRSIAGVAEVHVVGKVKREHDGASCDPTALQAAGVSVAQVVQALGQQNLAAPVGRLNGDARRALDPPQGPSRERSEFGNLVVADRGGQLIRLGQVANVNDGTEEPRTLALFNGKRGGRHRHQEVEGLQHDRRARRRSARTWRELQKTLPPGAKLRRREELGRAREPRGAQRRGGADRGRAAHGARRVPVPELVALDGDHRVSRCRCRCSRPSSPCGRSASRSNTMSLLGLSLAIGILIDDAIVVRENIVRHIEMGKDHFDGVARGHRRDRARRRGDDVLDSRGVRADRLHAGRGGQWFKPFALTIACSVLVSLFVSFSLDPMLSAYWADPQVEDHEHARRDPISRRSHDSTLVQPPGGELQEGHRVGARSSARGDRARAGGDVRARARACRRAIGGAELRAGERPQRDQSHHRDAAGIESRVHAAAQPKRRREHRAQRIREVAYTYTRSAGRCRSRAPGVDQAIIYVRLVPKAKRHIEPGRSWAREFCAASSRTSPARRCRCSRATSAAR